MIVCDNGSSDDVASVVRLIVFTRLPSPGATKTRLIPAIGPLQAAELQRRMTERTIATARQLNDVCMEVRYAGGTELKMRDWLGGGLMYRPQCGGDLGQRMECAFDDALDEGCERIVIVGSDCPALTSRRMGEAFDALSESDVVLGPSIDGGYYLIGLRRSAALFEGVEWGTDSVLASTLKKAESLGLSVKQLGELADIDRPEDLAQLPPDLRIE